MTRRSPPWTRRCCFTLQQDLSRKYERRTSAARHGELSDGRGEVSDGTASLYWLAYMNKNNIDRTQTARRGELSDGRGEVSDGAASPVKPLLWLLEAGISAEYIRLTKKHQYTPPGPHWGAECDSLMKGFEHFTDGTASLDWLMLQLLEPRILLFYSSISWINVSETCVIEWDSPDNYRAIF
ncbi:hypothetical protein K438DRAFT_1764433 [Mycena galopus ATCC 62051]|nr:hypothetical protein K438DRAFT_1764433 [Mycena galopus ATCC 62051]